VILDFDGMVNYYTALPYRFGIIILQIRIGIDIKPNRREHIYSGDNRYLRHVEV
jgi:hypothetical protein